MADVMRKRWDLGSNPASIADFPIATADAFEIGDILWWDQANSAVRPVSHANVWAANLAGSRGKVHEWFVGVCQSAHAAADAAVTTVRVAQRGAFEYPLDTAGTYEIGDFVTVVQDGSNSYFLDQQVARLAPLTTGNAELSIGKVVKRTATSLSSIWFEIAGRFTMGGGPRAHLIS